MERCPTCETRVRTRNDGTLEPIISDEKAVECAALLTRAAEAMRSSLGHMKTTGASKAAVNRVICSLADIDAFTDAASPKPFTDECPVGESA